MGPALSRSRAITDQHNLGPLSESGDGATETCAYDRRGSPLLAIRGGWKRLIRSD